MKRSYTKIIGLFIIAVLATLSYEIASNQVRAQISYGELVDKITILTIKSERVTESNKLANIKTELIALLQLFDEYIGNRTDIAELMTQLKKINEALWDIEDILRIKERNKEFDNDFIHLARSVYTTNDNRYLVKRTIDNVLGSQIIEEKSYETYI